MWGEVRGGEGEKGTYVFGKEEEKHDERAR